MKTEDIIAEALEGAGREELLRLQVLIAEKMAELLEEEKAASGSANLPIADRDRAWDADAAVGRIRKWAEAEDEPNAKYRSGFFWYDSKVPDNFGSYKLPFTDVLNGTLTAIPRGIFAVAGVLSGARGGVAIPEKDQTAIKGRVAGYYARMRKKFDDEGLVAPWKEEKEHSPEECMDCEKPPTHVVLWGEDLATAWFCEEHGASWIKAVHQLQEGEDPREHDFEKYQQKEFEGAVRGEEKEHSPSKCMRCEKAPTIVVIWADGRGRAWFCDKCLEEWSSEESRDVVAEHRLEEDEDPGDWHPKPPGLKEESLCKDSEVKDHYTDVSEVDLRERLAALEHEQWMKWAGAVMPEVSPERQARWQQYMVPYEELTEEAKDDDRKWADKVLEILNEAPEEAEAEEKEESLRKDPGLEEPDGGGLTDEQMRARILHESEVVQEELSPVEEEQQVKPEELVSQQKRMRCPACGFEEVDFRPNLRCPECGNAILEEVRKSTSVEELAESTLHRSFTVLADGLFALGYMSRDERIALSSVIGDTLGRFGELFQEKWAEERGLNPDISKEDVISLLAGVFKEVLAESGKPSQSLKDRFGEVRVVAQTIMQALRSKHKSALSAWKDSAGVGHYVALCSAELEDLEEETVETRAMDYSMALSRRHGFRPLLTVTHAPWARVGKNTWELRLGKFWLEGGVFDETWLARKAFRAIQEDREGDLRISIAFLYLPAWRSEGGRYERLFRYASGITRNPALPITAIQVRGALSD